MERPPSPPRPECICQRLHNFNLPGVGWRRRRFLVCVNVQPHPPPPFTPPPYPLPLPPPSLSSSTSPSSPSSPPSPPPPSSPTLSPPFLPSGLPVPEPTATEDYYSTSKFCPGNEIGPEYTTDGADLRFSRYAGSGGDEDDGTKNGAATVLPPRTPRTDRKFQNGESEDLLYDLRSSSRSGHKYYDKEEKVRFSATLSREEIAEDYAAMTGKRLPRRPKRPRGLQKRLNILSPGLCLPMEPWRSQQKDTPSPNVPEK